MVSILTQFILNRSQHVMVDGCRSKLIIASMAAVQAEDVCASFLFVGDLNGHHREWLGSMTTNCRRIAAFDIETVSCCDQLVVGPTVLVVEHLTS